jgi:hypothetical protein
LPTLAALRKDLVDDASEEAPVQGGVAKAGSRGQDGRAGKATARTGLRATVPRWQDSDPAN